MRLGWLLAVASLSACLRSELVECSDGRLCPLGTACDDEHASCASPDQLTACNDRVDGSQCDAAGTAGICDLGVCIPGCGDGVEGAGEECDDGNFRSHDGCSSRCVAERATWTQWRSPWQGRADHAAAYHEASGQLVVYGGIDLDRVLGDVWIRDSAGTWMQSTPPMPPRRGAAMVYDPVRQLIVMFGGSDPLGDARNDTWEFDGTTWVERAPLMSPPPRASAGLAFDGGTNRLVLFGGTDNGFSTLADTWEYDGTTWREVTIANPPGPRYDHQMVWHPERQRVVMFAGYAVLTVRGDTWEYTNGTWTQVTPSVAPFPRFAYAMTYSPALQRIVLFGGRVNDSTTFADTWFYDGTWSQHTLSPTAPPHRSSATLVDAGSVRVLVGGVSNSEGPRADLWQFDDNGLWLEAVPDLEPSPRESHLVWDSRSEAAVTFGGYGAGLPNDAWAFRDGVWARYSTQGMPFRAFHAATFDDKRGRAIMFGGLDVGFGPRSDTFILDATTRAWSLLTGPAPPPRADSVLAYDSARGVAVLHGGYVAGAEVDDTWELDGDVWTQSTGGPRPELAPYQQIGYDPTGERFLLLALDSSTWAYKNRVWTQIAPARPDIATRVAAPIVYNPERRRMTMIGGMGAREPLQEVWELEDETWTRVETVGESPISRLGASAIAHRGQRALMVFGGFNAVQQFGGTWFLQYTSTTPDEACSNSLDDDGDKHVDAMDPDCN